MKCALVGCGAIAREHIAALAKVSNAEVVAVCDLSPIKAEATAERFKIPSWYSDLNHMLNEVRPDLVHITSPPASHFSIAKTCLSAGLNVLSEKPITIEHHEFVALKQLALQNRCVLLENQQLRCHSSILRLRDLLSSGTLGDLLHLQIHVALNSVSANSPYADKNAPHFSLALRGGVIGDFLPHIACLTHVFVGSVTDLRTIWTKRVSDSVLPADEFRALMKAERATASVAFSGSTSLNAFWISLFGTKMNAEIDLFEFPRLVTRRVRATEPALASLIDGIVESRDLFRGTAASFLRKLSGASSYSGLPEFFSQIYHSLESKAPQLIPLDEIDEIARLVESFTKRELEI